MTIKDTLRTAIVVLASWSAVVAGFLLADALASVVRELVRFALWLHMRP